MKSIAKPLLAVCLSAGLLGLFIVLSHSLAQEKTPMPSHAPLRTGEKKEEIIARLDRRIPRLMKEGDVPGLSVAMLRDGKLVWHRGFGVKNSKINDQVGDSTVFEAASLSKPVFAYGVMKLVEAGKIDLDTPLNSYLPGNYDVGDDARLNQITARRVLSHTTGFPNWRVRGGELKIHFTPGEKFSYSGEGFVYLARVVEHITGEKFDDLMKRLVFDPLGMKSSSYVWQEAYESQKTDSHNVKGEPTGRAKPNRANAAASLHTTAEDYGKFVAAILNRTGLKKETVRLMLTPQIKVDERGTNTTNRPADRLSPYISWGLGWGLEQTSDGLSFWHWGDNGNSKAFIVAY
ncbi:MAG: beta-lactamase family protein, partial [Blastocatellia bacterium]|nr:beta-lactamase family protein [Blastocatellia bacterium]